MEDVVTPSCRAVSAREMGTSPRSFFAIFSLSCETCRKNVPSGVCEVKMKFDKKAIRVEVLLSTSFAVRQAKNY